MYYTYSYINFCSHQVRPALEIMYHISLSEDFLKYSLKLACVRVRANVEMWEFESVRIFHDITCLSLYVVDITRLLRPSSSFLGLVWYLLPTIFKSKPSSEDDEDVCMLHDIAKSRTFDSGRRCVFIW